MPTRSTLPAWVFVPVVLMLLTAATGVQYLREQRYPPPPPSEASLYLTSGTTARRLSVGFNALAADVYWIRAILYYGDMKLRLSRRTAAKAPLSADAAGEYGLLYPMLDLTTSLDPKFNIAYRFGSIFLAEAYPGGPGRPDQAIALLEKGLQHQPDKWEYMQDIGFVHYWWRRDFTSAAAWFDRASRVEGAPWFLKSLAATTLAAGGDRQSSRMMWQAIHESAEIDWLRQDAEKHLLQFDAMDAMDQIQARVDRAAAQMPGLGASWQSLIRARVIPGIPVDPSGTPFQLDAAGVVSLSPTSPLYPLPQEPPHVASPVS